MRRLGYSLLVLSLVGNAVLGVFVLRGLRAASGTANSVLSGATPPAQREPNGPLSVPPEPPLKDPLVIDPVEVVARMKADGYPPQLIAAAARGTFIAGNDGQSYRLDVIRSQRWLAGSGDVGQFTDDASLTGGSRFLEAMEALGEVPSASREELRARLDSFQFPGVAPERMARAKEVVAEVTGINLDRPMGVSWGGQGPKVARNFPGLSTRLQEVLMPGELEDFFRYNAWMDGSVANIVQGLLRNAEYDQEKYIGIADAANALVREQPATDLKAALIPEFRNRLGDAEFVKLLPEYNIQVAGVDSVLAQLNVSATARVDIFFEMVRAETALSGKRGAERTTFIEQSRQDISRIGNLSPEQAEALARNPQSRYLYRRPN